MRELLPSLAAGKKAKDARATRRRSDKTLDKEINRAVKMLAEDNKQRRRAQLDAERAASLWANNGGFPASHSLRWLS